MPQSILEMAKDLVMAQIQAGHVPPDDMHHALQQSYANLTTLKQKEEAGAGGGVETNGKVPAPVNWRKSITRQTIACLECGAAFKQLSNRHLEAHGLDRRSYRAKYGMPRTQPLAARETTAQRRRIVQQTRPWEKTPRYRATQEREAAHQQAAAATPAVPAKKRRPRQRSVAARGT